MIRMIRLITVTCLLHTVSVIVSFPFQWKIVGGITAKEGQFPYQVSLRVLGFHKCGGSILNKRWILTAAHCLHSYHIEDLTIIVGTNKLHEGGLTYEIDSIILHEHFDKIRKVNDCALVKLKQDLIFNKFIQPIQLNKDKISNGEEVILIGWGRLSLDGIAPNCLQWITLKTLSQKECQSKFIEKIYETEICTLNKLGEGACYGDSGGPLVWKSKVAGIVSWSHPCATDYPDIFTKVSSFIPWIEDKISKF